MKFKYINSKGEIIDMCEYPYLLQSGDLLDYSWSYEKGNKCIKNVCHDVGERSFKIAIVPDLSLSYEEKIEAKKKAAQRLFNVIEYDVANNADGRIETDTGSYLPCRIVASTKSDWENPTSYMFCDLTAVCGKNTWINEMKKSFFPVLEAKSDSGMFDYPYDYEYDYASQITGKDMLNIDHISASLFKLTIFGACLNPCIYINNHKYCIYTSLDKDEYLVIDARKNTIIKYSYDGSTENIYDLRGKEQSVFEAIPAGNIPVMWDGSFGFDITLYLERSEPLWS